MMVFRSNLMLVATIGSYWLSATQVLSQDDWIPIEDPEAVRALVSDRAFDGKYWLHFYRSDGNMAYYHVDTDAMSVRKWTVEENGELCVAIFQKPDHILDCFTINRSGSDQEKFLLKWQSGSNAFEFLDEPPENMAQAVVEIAGPHN